MTDQLFEEPRLLIEDFERDNHIARLLDDLLQRNPEAIVFAAVNLGGIVIDRADTPQGTSTPGSISILQAAINDKGVRRISFDDSTEQILDADEGLQSLITKMQQRKGVNLDKKQVRGVEDNPQAIADRDRIWYLRIASLALRRMDWNAQNQSKSEGSSLSLAS